MCFDASESEYASAAIASGWVSGSGDYLRRFEQALQARTSRAAVVAVNSGSSALELTLLALGIGPGDEVIVPALTFVAPAAAVRSVGATPVLCDISARDWTIDPELAGRLITRRTRAIVAVDMFGHPCDFDALLALGVPVIEDAAEAHGSTYHGAPAGSFGVASVMSFFANKTITTGEGGSIGTDDPQLAAALRTLANHGMDPARPYWTEVIGRSCKMTNVTAAIGLAQVERWDALVAGRLRVAARYAEHLGQAPVGLQPMVDGCHVACWLYAITTPARDAVVAQLRADGIDARAIWPAVGSLAPYRSGLREPCPVAELVSTTALLLPTWSDMPDATIDDVAQHVVRALEHAGARAQPPRRLVA